MGHMRIRSAKLTWAYEHRVEIKTEGALPAGQRRWYARLTRIDRLQAEIRK